MLPSGGWRAHARDLRERGDVGPRRAWYSSAMRIALVSSLLCLGLGLASPARAHLHLVEPAARDGGEELKDGPCGQTGSVRGSVVTTFEAGQTIEIVIDEYIDHPSHYRVAFDVDGDDDFEDPVCLENCETSGPDPVFALGDPEIVLVDFIADAGTREQRFTVTLPDVVCDRCTLQVIQVMYDKRPYTIGGNDNYYQCADVVLVARPGGDAGVEPGEDAGPTLDAGPRDGGTRDAGADAGRRDAGDHDHDHDEVSGGCSCRVVSSDARASLPFVLALFALRRRTPSSLGRRSRDRRATIPS